MALGDLAGGRQEQRGGKRHRHAGALGRGPQPVERPVGHPLALVPFVEIEAQPDHARPLPMGDEVAAVRVVEIEPAHDAEAIGIFPHRLHRQLVRIPVPQHRVDQRAVDAGFIHRGDRLRRRVWLLAVRRRWRALFPEMDLRVDDQHWCVTPASCQSQRRLGRPPAIGERGGQQSVTRDRSPGPCHRRASRASVAPAASW